MVDNVKVEEEGFELNTENTLSVTPPVTPQVINKDQQLKDIIYGMEAQITNLASVINVAQAFAIQGKLNTLVSQAISIL